MKRSLALLVVCGLSAAPLAAEVLVRPSTSGRPKITNEGTVPAAVRHTPSRSTRVVPAVRRADGGLRELIAGAARSQGLDPRLVEAVIQAESAWDAGAVSSKGAMGLMQIMPATARELSLTKPFDPSDNIRAGTRYLRRMFDLFQGRSDLALAAYNAGPSTVTAYGGVPPYPETVRYVRRVLRMWLGDEAPAVTPATGRSASPGPPSAPVQWGERDARPHLTNVQ